MAKASEWFLTRLFHNEFKTIEIPKKGSIEIGRDNRNSCISISVPTFAHVSRKHCILQISDGRLILIDRFSSGGTYVGDRRLSMAQPGEMVLQEGDMVGIGTHTNDTDHFYKQNSHVLFYRVCRRASPGEVVLVSDDDEDVIYLSDEKEDVGGLPIQLEDKDMKILPSKPASERCMLSVGSTISREISEGNIPATKVCTVQSNTSDTNALCTRNQAFHECAVSVISEKIEPSSWEEAYDRIVNIKTEFDNSIIICDDEYTDWNHIRSEADSLIVLSDEEYTDEHYTQVVRDDIKQESVDDVDQFEPEQSATEEGLDKDPHDMEEENTYARWKNKVYNHTERIVVKDVNPNVPSASVDEEITPLSDPEQQPCDAITVSKSTDSTLPSGPEPASASSSHVVVMQSEEDALTSNREHISSGSEKPARKRQYESVAGETSAPAMRPTEEQKHNDKSAKQSDVEFKKPTSISKRRQSIIEVNLFENPSKPKGVPERFSSSSSTTASAAALKEKEIPPPAKGIPKRRSSLYDLNSMISKTKKRRYSVQDRNPVKAAATPSDILKKQVRSNRLKEVAEHAKQYSPPTIEAVKTGSTKPKVKYTEQNRGVFLTKPVPTQPKPMPSSRPTIGDDIICTQSTALDQLGVADEEPVGDLRTPSKMTFQSVERLSNVDRPVTKPTNTILKGPPRPSKSLTTQQSISKPKNGITQQKVSEEHVTQQSSMNKTKPKSVMKTTPPIEHVSGRVRSSQHVMFDEKVQTLCYQRYIRGFSTPFPTDLEKTQRRNEMEILSNILAWRVDWVASATQGPFTGHMTLQQVVENYPNLQAFRNTLHPLLIREMWADIVSHCKTIQQQWVKLFDVHVQEIPFKLCQITCRVPIKARSFTRISQIGILYYVSGKANKKHRLFAYVSDRCRDYSTTRTDWQENDWMNFIMYAARSELEGLQAGIQFHFCPITTLLEHLRGFKALSSVQYSPLLPNILSPSQNNSVLVQRGKEFTGRQKLRDNIVARIGPEALNKVQMDVVLSVLEECLHWDEPSISLIQGPPGTGKSHVISHLALQLMYMRPRYKKVKVLICAQSNNAIDVIVKRLISLQSTKVREERFILHRIGSREKIDPECLQVFFDDLVNHVINKNSRLIDGLNRVDVNVERIRNRFFDEGDIVCTTLGSCYQLPPLSKDFYYDVCIIDEATRCTEVCTLLPLMYGMPKLVLVGDINQLPATVLDKECINAGFNRSLFSRLHDAEGGAGTMKMLSVQYRMHPEICRWPNAYFYKRQLKNDPSTNEGARTHCALKPYLVVGLTYDQELTQAQHEIYNRDEIEFVIGLLKSVVENCRKESIAIITPYNRQKKEIEKQLSNNNILKGVQVNSIDSVQGKEYDVVIISLARSKGAGFLNNPERINVALTRARKCLVLCGNFSFLREEPVWKFLLEDAKKRNRFVHATGDTIQDEIASIMKHLKKTRK